jgi:hypothetical protein
VLGLIAAVVLSQAGAAEGSGARSRPLSITVGGGASLASYEAGYLYLLAEDLKESGAFETKMVTGTSAGSANGLLAVLRSCLESNPFPSKDPGWLAWRDIGFWELVDTSRGPDHALFSTDAMAKSFEAARVLWKRGLPERCDVVLGVVVTRLAPREVDLQEGLVVSRIEANFVVRIRGRGPGKPPRLTNYPSRSLHLAQPLLALVPDDDDPAAAGENFTQLRNLLFASAAFPLVFAPQPLQYCLSKPVPPGEQGTAKDLKCTVPDFEDLFVDGGMLDNGPLRLDWQMTEGQLFEHDGRTRWLEPFTRPEGARADTFHLYLAPYMTAYPPDLDEVDDPKDKGLLRQFLRLSVGFVEGARAKELYALAHEQPGLAPRMRLTMGQFPKASELLYAFGGFFEHDFRLFDFTLGMYDAWRGRKGEDPARAQVVFDERRFERDPEYRREWSRFACMLAVYEPGLERLAPACDGPDLDTFRILVQVSVDRLYDACQPEQRAQPGTLGHRHHHCSRAKVGEAAPRVPEVRELSARERVRQPSETAFDFFMRLLGAYGFRFTDLGLARDNATLGRLAIRRELDVLVDSWAASQASFTDRFLAKTGGRIALNNLQFSPPKFSMYFVLGTLAEYGVSVVPFGWRSHWFQVTAAFEVLDFVSLFNPGQQHVAFGLTAGPEFHLSFLSDAVVQSRLAVRAGVQLGTRDVFGSKACADVSSDPRWCTTALLEAVGSVALLERLRMQLIWQTYPAVIGKDARWYALQFALGVQF